jgi:hypothetical protein
MARTINRSGYKIRRAISGAARPIASTAVRAATQLNSSMKRGSEKVAYAVRHTTQKMSKSVKAGVDATKQILGGATANMKHAIANKVKDARARMQAKDMSTRYYKKRLKKNIKIAKKSGTPIVDAYDEALHYSHRRRRLRQVNKAVIAGGSVVLLGYGMSEAAKNIKHNVQDVVSAGSDTNNKSN